MTVHRSDDESIVGAESVGFREDFPCSGDIQHGHVIEDDDHHGPRLRTSFSHELIVSQSVGKAAETTPVEQRHSATE